MASPCPAPPPSRSRRRDHRRHHPLDQQSLDHPPVADRRAAQTPISTRSSTISARSAMPWHSCRMRISSISAARTRRCGRGVTTVCGPGTGWAWRGAEAEWRLSGPVDEGGHINFAPLDALEDAMLRRLRKIFTRVSAERIVAGPASSPSTKRWPNWKAAPSSAATTDDLAGGAGGHGLDRARRARSLLSVAGRGRGRPGAGAWREGGGDRRRPGPAHQGQADPLGLRPALRRQGAVPVDDGGDARQLITHPQPGLFGARRRLRPGA